MIHMGAIVSSTNHDLLVGETTNAKPRRNHKGKDKRNIEFKPKEEFDPSDGSNSKALRRKNIIGLTRASAPTIRKETIHRNIV